MGKHSGEVQKNWSKNTQNIVHSSIDICLEDKTYFFIEMENVQKKFSYLARIKSIFLGFQAIFVKFCKKNAFSNWQSLLTSIYLLKKFLPTTKSNFDLLKMKCRLKAQLPLPSWDDEVYNKTEGQEIVSNSSDRKDNRSKSWMN